MKFTFKTLLIVSIIAVSAGFVSCSDDDDFTATIFDSDPSIDYLDKSLYTFPLDTFCKKEFLEPYNRKFIYKMEDKGSDMNKNLTPATYDKSVDLAVLTKYLWYDIYKDVASDEFLKENSPRIIHVIGSKNYNPSQGTETLGDASSGVKINLYNVNNLDASNITMMNQYFFKTMHHEFAHILDQTHLRPTSFNTISNSNYDAAGWSDSPDSLKSGFGFVSSYASSAVAEDWAECLSVFVTSDSISWNKLLNSASYEWEEVDCKTVNDYNKLIKPGCSLDTIGYFKEADNGENKIYRRKCLRNADGSVSLDKDGNVQWIHETGIDGRAVILQKIDLVRNYLKEHYNINLDLLRREVQTHMYVTNEDGTFKVGRDGYLINKLVSVLPSGETLMDSLRQEVYKYKALQQ